MQTLRKIDTDAPLPSGPESETQLQLQPAPAMGLADASHADIPSPARALQQRLLEQMNAEAMDDDGVRWAPRTTLLVTSGASLALWGVIALAVAAFR